MPIPPPGDLPDPGVLPTSAPQTLPPHCPGRSETRAAQVLPLHPSQLRPRVDIRICSPPGSYATPTLSAPGSLAPPARRAGGASIAHRGRAVPQEPARDPLSPAPSAVRSPRSPAPLCPLGLSSCLLGSRFPALGSQSRVLALDSGSVGAHRRPCGSSLPRATWETREGAEQGRDRWAPAATSSRTLAPRRSSAGWKGSPGGPVISDTWDS